MDDSVIFVEEIRRRDSDVIVVESENSNPVVNNSRRTRRKLQRRCKEKISLITISSESGSEETNDSQGHQSNKDVEPQRHELFNTELKTNENETKQFKLECPICLEPLENLEIKITLCGHMFCQKCLDVILGKPNPSCPRCRQKLVKVQLRSVFI